MCIITYPPRLIYTFFGNLRGKITKWNYSFLKVCDLAGPTEI